MLLGKLTRGGAFAAVLAGVLGVPVIAHAETDNFANGNGHNGALTVAASAQQTINSYVGLTADAAAGATTLTVSTVLGNPQGFVAGDLVMVWRSTGVAPSEAPSGDQNKQVNLDTAASTTSTTATVAGATGTYEFARVQSFVAATATTPGTMTLTAPLVSAFTRYVSQVVRVPEFTSVNIAASGTLLSTAFQEVKAIGNSATPNVTAPNPEAPWAGGITIFFAQDAVANAGVIHSNARGFHGAVPPQNRILATPGLINCDNNPVDGSSANGANYGQKGQGVVHSLYTAASGGKGNRANAGGGGQCVEGGGGGGANGGKGGVGSASLLGLGVGGYPGVNIDFTIASHLTMGGGGGAGRTIAAGFSSVGYGGFGGGVVYVRARAMSGAGKLQANGGGGEDTGLIGLPTDIASEGSGGGGAGGTIVVRLSGELDCDSLASPGGNGGDAAVIGLPIFGSGGGGGGGRVSYTAQSKTPNCKVIVTPGKNGNTGSDPGQPGESDPPSDAVCDASFGAGTLTSCPDATSPICAGGKCLPCNGDFNSGTSAACGQVNPLCNLQAGTCGKGCTVDSECTSAEWCAPVLAGGAGICTPKTSNKLPLPGYPPIDGRCTEGNGARVCISAVCEPADNLCGYLNGTACTVLSQCRSGVCFSDNTCGLPNGQVCQNNEQCRSNSCVDGLCKGCVMDSQCSNGQLCDVNAGVCRVRATDTAGIIEGGGCSCSTTPSTTASPFAALGAAAAALLAWRRRKRTQAANNSGMKG